MEPPGNFAQKTRAGRWGDFLKLAFVDDGLGQLLASQPASPVHLCCVLFMDPLLDGLAIAYLRLVDQPRSGRSSNPLLKQRLMPRSSLCFEYIN